MQLDPKEYLYDIQQPADLLAQFTAGKAFPDYQREPMLRFAVERGLVIIGEALVQLVKQNAAWPSESANTVASLRFATFLSMFMPKWMIGLCGILSKASFLCCVNRPRTCCANSKLKAESNRGDNLIVRLD